MLKAARFLSDFALTSDMVAVSRSGRFDNPALELKAYSEGKLESRRWLFSDTTGFHDAQEGAFVFALEGFTATHFSGVDVVRDRAVPVVYFGFSVLVIGTFLSFYVVYGQVRVRMSAKAEGVEVSLACRCSRNPLDFERGFRACADEISGVSEGRSS